MTTTLQRQNLATQASFTLVGAVGNVWLGHTRTGDKASTLSLGNWNGTYYTKIQDGLVSSAAGMLDMNQSAGLNGTASATYILMRAAINPQFI